MTYNQTFRAKGLLDGCCTLPEMAAALERAAATLRQMHADGIALEGSVQDDYAFLVASSESAAHKYGLHPCEDSGTDPELASRPTRLTLLKGGTSPDEPPTGG